MPAILESKFLAFGENTSPGETPEALGNDLPLDFDTKGPAGDGSESDTTIAETVALHLITLAFDLEPDLTAH
jgi:hypothetical protein